MTDSLFLYRLTVNEYYCDPSNWTVAQHAAFLDDLGEAGHLAFAGRTQYEFDHPDLLGIAVVRAESLEAADRMMGDDPAVAQGIHQGSLHPFTMAIRHLTKFEQETFGHNNNG